MYLRFYLSLTSLFFLSYGNALSCKEKVASTFPVEQNKKEKIIPKKFKKGVTDKEQTVSIRYSKKTIIIITSIILFVVLLVGLLLYYLSSNKWQPYEPCILVLPEELKEGILHATLADHQSMILTRNDECYLYNSKSQGKTCIGKGTHAKLSSTERFILLFNQKESSMSLYDIQNGKLVKDIIKGVDLVNYHQAKFSAHDQFVALTKKMKAIDHEVYMYLRLYSTESITKGEKKPIISGLPAKSFQFSKISEGSFYRASVGSGNDAMVFYSNLENQVKPPMMRDFATEEKAPFTEEDQYIVMKNEDPSYFLVHNLRNDTYLNSGDFPEEINYSEAYHEGFDVDNVLITDDHLYMVTEKKVTIIAILLPCTI